MTTGQYMFFVKILGFYIKTLIFAIVLTKFLTKIFNNEQSRIN